uniref:RimI protein n=1 Tax=Fopius arisanus TaxID=64838 RepID=A0A0C9RGJ7_9HYME
MECPGPVERGRNFRLLMNEELPLLLEFLAGYLPESLKFHQTVLTYMRNKVWQFHFYVADGWPAVPICLHFPGMTLSPHGLLYESFGVFCPNKSLDNLHLLRDEDILIDWEKPMYINFVHHEIAGELFDLYDGTGTIERVLGDVWACEDPANTIQIEDEPIEGEPEVQVLPLCPEHAEGIHELYPANDMECHELFLRLIRILPAAGVFVDGKLAAWMIQSYYGAMFSMQTKPEYRRKGYGTRLARYLTKTVADRGYTPFVVIRPENEASQSLYKKLGFRKLYQTVRATFTPYNCQKILDEDASLQSTDLSDIVRKFQMEQRVINVLQGDEDTTVMADNEDNEGDDTIRDPTDSPKEDDEDEIEENGFTRNAECLQPIEEQPEDRIDSVDDDRCENNGTMQDVVSTDAGDCPDDNGDE